MVGDVEGTGASGELVKVKRGFARNYLIPKKKAAYVTEANREKYSHLINAEANSSADVALSAAHAQKRVSDVQVAIQSALNASADNASSAGIVMVAKATEAGSLYGSIGPNDIATHLKSLGVAEVTPADVTMQTIKTAGDEVHKLHIAGMEVTLQVKSE
jgi:large subunit ribosomal protein L9